MDEITTEYIDALPTIPYIFEELVPRNLQFSNKQETYQYIQDHVLTNESLSNWALAAIATWWQVGRNGGIDFRPTNIVADMYHFGWIVKRNWSRNHMDRLVFMANTYFLQTRDIYGFVERMGIDNIEIYVRCNHDIFAIKCD